MTDSVHTIKWTETAFAVGQRYRIVYRVERREVVVVIVAVGRRKARDKNDI
jgi:mRNA-degrading endonuclease RelE of RelBE toxin-antitoxin system